jgi:homoserine dehydrogenase
VEGIRDISTLDIQFAHQLGYEIKLLAIVRPLSRTRVEVRVHPTLIPKTNRLSSIRGSTNAIIVRGHVVGDIEFSGPGAGGDATASAVLSDLVQASTLFLQSRAYQSRHRGTPPHGGFFSINPTSLCLDTDGPDVASIDSVMSRYYLRLAVDDQPGVMAQVSSILGRSKIGICSVIQPERHESKSVPLIFMSYEARHDAMQRALREIRHLKCVRSKPVIFPVETFES